MPSTRHANPIQKLSPGITTMIRMDHTAVLATFHKYRIDAAPEKKRALVNTIAAAVEIHAQLEEEIFYPAMRAVDPELVDKSVPEHNRMRELIARLRAMEPDDDAYDRVVMELMREIMHHVADEETILLPEAERQLAGELESLGWRMTQRRFQLAGPRAGEIAVNTARAFPGAMLATTAILAVGAFMAGRALTGRNGNGSGIKAMLPDKGRRMLGLARS